KTFVIGVGIFAGVTVLGLVTSYANINFLRNSAFDVNNRPGVYLNSTLETLNAKYGTILFKQNMSEIYTGVFVSASMTARDIIFEENVCTDGTGSSVSFGVLLQSSGLGPRTITAYNSLRFIFNQAG